MPVSPMATASVLAIGCLLALPFLGLAIILLLHRSPSRRALSGSILLAGVTSSLLAACFGFTTLSAPIAPYETTPGSFWTLSQPLLIFFYIGFGLGTITASALGIPGSYVWSWYRSRRDSSKKAPPA